MRVFHIKVFDGMIEGTDVVYTSSEFDEQLASPTTMIVIAVVSNVSGTTPTLTVRSEQSPDRVRWIVSETPEIDAASLTAGTVEAIGGDPAAPRSGFARFGLSLAGTTPAAHVTLWVTGHDDNPFS